MLTAQWKGFIMIIPNLFPNLAFTFYPATVHKTL